MGPLCGRCAWLGLSACLLLGGAASGALAEERLGTFNFVFENDLFANTDRHYTNGVRLSWLTAAGQEPAWSRAMARAFPLLDDVADIRIEYALGQSMFGPRDITRRVPDPDDQPYAGWLYGAIGAIGSTGSRLDQLELSLGVVGPAALAAQAQKAAHRLSGADRPRGWRNQLANEPALQLTYRRSWRALASAEVLGFSVDATPHVGAALGNVFIYGSTGMMLRLGFNLPDDYGPPRVQPSLPGSGFFRPQPGFGWYLFAGVDGRVVGRNIFLDGNSFRDGPGVDRRIFVGDLQAGIAFVLGDVRIAYTHVLRTEEFHGQGENSKFGAFSLSWRF
ncbi:MAG: lipid A deacylase LpxR family protein [Alphaproteobacteria bacterium]|nr:lipid A deacylase LpxR family protein [Alphaproteobacteria bacterium]